MAEKVETFKEKNEKLVQNAIDILVEAKGVMAINDIGEATLKFLLVAQKYQKAGTRWGLIEETALDFARAVVNAEKVYYP